MPKLSEIRKHLRSQDNHCTADPFFAVQEKRKIYGITSEHTEKFAWIDEDSFEEVDRRKSARLENSYKATGVIRKGYRRLGYVETWEFVTGCFTSAGCKAYIKANGHNHRGELRIYAYSLWRNEEMISLRRLLGGFASPDEYFIICTSGGCSDNILFLGPNRNGYTCDLQKAGRYTKDEAANIQQIRGTDFAVPCANVLQFSEFRTCVSSREQNRLVNFSKKLFPRNTEAQHA